MNGAQLIAAERQRQVRAEGFSEDGDRKHGSGQLARAGIFYAHAAFIQSTILKPPRLPVPYLWPLRKKWWKPSRDPIRNLVKAGALIAAEIDRLQHAKEKK